MQEFDEIRSVIKTLEKILPTVKQKQVGTENIQDIQLAVKEINRILYHSERLRFQKEYDLQTEEGYLAYVREIETILKQWKDSMDHRTGKRTDREFQEIYECFRYADIDEIYLKTVQHYMKLPEELRIEFLALPYRYTFLKNKIDFTKNDFSLIAQHVELMANSAEKYKWLYGRLADQRSRMVLNGIITYWFTFNVGKLHSLCETVFSDYFDLDILECGENDVIVDLGAYTGDSVQNYINTYGAYKRIYAYECTPATYERLVLNVAGYQNVVTRQKGVGSKAGSMFLDADGLKAGNKLLEQGNIEVSVTTLDDDIEEPVHVIKMDIEGSEKDAILGAKSHIRKEKPKLLVSSYHIPEDIFEIPYLIDSIRDDYKFYMRFNGHGCLWPCDYVLFAV